MKGDVEDFDAKKEYLDAAEMMDFELKIDFLIRKAQKKQRDEQLRAPHLKVEPETIWMEVEKDFLTGLCGGTYPDTNYVIWKNVRVCAHDSAQLIAKEEGKTIHEVVFKNEKSYKLNTVLKK